MQVNLSPSEYAMLCRVADYYGSYPAQLAHDWIMREAAVQYQQLYAPTLQSTEWGQDLGSGAGSAPTPKHPGPTP